MPFMQSLFTRLLPRKWAEDMRTESLEWMMQCPCGDEISVWDSGGIRYKAAGNPKRLRACPKCGKRTWHNVYRKKAVPGNPPVSDKGP